MRILVIDGNRERDTQMKSLLAGICGVEAEVADSAWKMLPMCLVDDYDFLFLDAAQADGAMRNAMRKLRKEPGIYGRPLIAALSEGCGSGRSEACRLVFDCFHERPSEPEDMARLL